MQLHPLFHEVIDSIRVVYVSKQTFFSIIYLPYKIWPNVGRKVQFNPSNPKRRTTGRAHYLFIYLSIGSPYDIMLEKKITISPSRLCFLCVWTVVRLKILRVTSVRLIVNTPRASLVSFSNERGDRLNWI